MIHIAIMKKQWKLIPKILIGEKTIESRWYKNRSKPWGKLKTGEIIYFKDSGEPVTIKATVKKVEQFDDLNEPKIARLLRKYNHQDLGTTEISEEIQNYVTGKKYCIIIHLKNPEKVKPFHIDKTGHGMMSAWICVENLNEMIILHRKL